MVLIITKKIARNFPSLYIKVAHLFHRNTPFGISPAFNPFFTSNVIPHSTEEIL